MTRIRSFVAFVVTTLASKLSVCLSVHLWWKDRFAKHPHRETQARTLSFLLEFTFHSNLVCVGKQEVNYGSGVKYSSKCASIYNSTVLQTVATKSFIDNRFLQRALKRHTQLENLTSDSLRVVPMQCNTSAMCSASGDSESQIRPTLTGKRITNQSIKLSSNQSNYHAINQSIIDSSY